MAIFESYGKWLINFLFVKTRVTKWRTIGEHVAGNDRYVNTNHIKYLLIDRISNMLGLPDKDMYNEANVDAFINSKLNVLDNYAPRKTNSTILLFIWNHALFSELVRISRISHLQW